MEKINAGVIQTQITNHFSVITTIPMSNFDENNYKIILNKSINYNVLNTILKDEFRSFLYDKSNINLIIYFMKEF
jgi:hypothetical protein